MNPSKRDRGNGCDSEPKRVRDDTGCTSSIGTVASRDGEQAVEEVQPVVAQSRTLLAGQTFVMTGTFPDLGGGEGLDLGKQRAKKMMESFGARVTSAVSGKTSFVLVGKAPGAKKLEAAEKKGVKIVSLEQLQLALESKSQVVALAALKAAEQPILGELSKGYTHEQRTAKSAREDMNQWNIIVSGSGSVLDRDFIKADALAPGSATVNPTTPLPIPSADTTPDSLPPIVAGELLETVNEGTPEPVFDRGQPASHVPMELQALIREVHNAEKGHLGVLKTLRALRARGTRFFDMARMATLYIRECPVCQKTRTSKPYIPAYATLLESAPFQSVHLDHITYLPTTKDGYKHILVMVDSFTHFTMLTATKTLGPPEVELALRQMFGRFGGPIEIYSDGHGSFDNNKLNEVARLMNLKRRFSLAYSSTSHGLVERANQEATRYLTGLQLESYGEDWQENLFLAEHIINTTPSLITGHTPFALMFGREAAEKRVPRVETLEDPDQAALWLNKLEMNLDILQNRANTVLDEELARRVSRSPDPTSGTVKVGDSVLKKPTPYEKGVRGKLSNKYMGPYTVRKIEGDKFIVLDSETGMTLSGKSDLFRKFIYPGAV